VKWKKCISTKKYLKKEDLKYFKNTIKLEKYSKLILTNNPYDIRTLKIYVIFLNHVLKLSDESKMYLDKTFYN